ncbi:hypothetical protein BST13_24210, partial [Mycobacterium aquaticum]
LDTGQDRLNHYWRPEDLFHPNTEAPNNPCDEDTGADADSQPADGAHAGDAQQADEAPAEPDPWPEVVTAGPEELRPTNAETTGDTDTDSNADEAPEHPAQPDAEPIQTIGGDDTDDAVTDEEAPAEPGPQPAEPGAQPAELHSEPVEAASEPQEPHHSNRQAPADGGNDPAGQALHAAPRPDSHPHTTQRPGNRDGPDDP